MIALYVIMIGQSNMLKQNKQDS